MSEEKDEEKVEVGAGTETLEFPGGVLVATALADAGFVIDPSEARRKIAQGAVTVNGFKVLDPGARIQTSCLLRLGLRKVVRIAVGTYSPDKQR